MRVLLVLTFALLASAYDEEEHESEYKDLSLEDFYGGEGEESPDAPFARAAAAIQSTDRLKEKEVLEEKEHKRPMRPDYPPPPPPGPYPGMPPMPPPPYHDEDMPPMPPGPYPPGFPWGMDPDDLMENDAARPGGPGGRYPPPPPYPFPPPPRRCPNKCDISLYDKCTCKTPAMYTKDGRGNCNVGASKLDLRVWCYVDDTDGKPEKLCPDALPSKSKPGYFWSRIACITG